MLEEKIYEACDHQRSQLPKIIAGAKKSKFPGVKFESKPAFNFIKDCVDIVEEYIPVVAYNLLTNPISDMKGKVTVEEVKDFMKRLDNYPQQTLLELMLVKIRNAGVSISVEDKKQSSTNVYGVYGEYDKSGYGGVETEV